MHMASKIWHFIIISFLQLSFYYEKCMSKNKKNIEATVATPLEITQLWARRGTKKFIPKMVPLIRIALSSGIFHLQLLLIHILIEILSFQKHLTRFFKFCCFN